MAAETLETQALVRTYLDHQEKLTDQTNAQIALAPKASLSGVNLSFLIFSFLTFSFLSDFEYIS